jgi:hypothetical protein
MTNVMSLSAKDCADNPLTTESKNDTLFQYDTRVINEVFC